MITSVDGSYQKTDVCHFNKLARDSVQEILSHIIWNDAWPIHTWKRLQTVCKLWNELAKSLITPVTITLPGNPQEFLKRYVELSMKDFIVSARLSITVCIDKERYLVPMALVEKKIKTSLTQEPTLPFIVSDRMLRRLYDLRFTIQENAPALTGGPRGIWIELGGRNTESMMKLTSLFEQYLPWKRKQLIAVALASSGMLCLILAHLIKR